MPIFQRRPTRRIAILPALMAAACMALPAHAQDLGEPHLIHEYEGWVALAVVVLSLVAAGVLIRRAMRR